MAEPLSLDGIAAPLRLIRRRGAARLTMSVSRATGIATVTAPPRMARAKIDAFLHDHRDWLVDKTSAHAAGIPFVDGMILPYRGRELRVARRDGRGVRLIGDVLEVGGAPEALPGALERWLRAQARTRLQTRSAAHAEALGVTFSRLTVKDTRSRWGSCSASGALSYSWRVILAPDEVLDYLAAHEVSHRREMNHSARFWAHVKSLRPDYREWQGWLREHGAGLHRYGR